jgi:hypothetical protein
MAYRLKPRLPRFVSDSSVVGFARSSGQQGTQNPNRVFIRIFNIDRRLCQTKPSMRGTLSSEAVQIFVSRASRTSPSPSASVDLAHLRPVRGRIGCATRNTSSEPEAEGELPPSLPAVYEA